MPEKIFQIRSFPERGWVNIPESWVLDFSVLKGLLTKSSQMFVIEVKYTDSNV
jgi:hypothetical protein